MSRIVTAAEARRVPWKNGRGTTLELATDAVEPGGPWTWRLAIADVPERGGFSAYPGIDRSMLVVEGSGLTLVRGADALVVPHAGPALAFAGEDEIVGVPQGAGVRDLNLMLARDRWRGALSIPDARDGGAEGEMVLVHALGGPLDVRVGDWEAALAEGDTLVTAGRLAFACAKGARAGVVTLSSA